MTTYDFISYFRKSDKGDSRHADMCLVISSISTISQGDVRETGLPPTHSLLPPLPPSPALVDAGIHFLIYVTTEAKWPRASDALLPTPTLLLISLGSGLRRLRRDFWMSFIISRPD